MSDDKPFGRPQRRRFSVRANGNWYDFIVTASSVPGGSRRFAGRMETGRHAITDPALG